MTPTAADVESVRKFLEWLDSSGAIIDIYREHMDGPGGAYSEARTVWTPVNHQTLLAKWQLGLAPA